MRKPPKEKAASILFEFEQRIEQACNQSSRHAHYLAAYQCAMIHIDSMIEQWDHASHRDIANKDYWHHVRIALIESTANHLLC